MTSKEPKTAAMPFLPSTTSDATPRTKNGYRTGLAVGKVFLPAICIWASLNAIGLAPFPGRNTAVLISRHNWKAEEQCPQATTILPKRNEELWNSLGDTYSTEAFKSRAIQWFSGAVQVETVTYDMMGPVGEDQRWKVFGSFHDYLHDAFPLTHSSLELTKVNEYGLVYVWKGADASLKPLLLAAHQDVVPVNNETLDKWIHPPYSGHFDGELVWGRGAIDDKSSLIGIMSSVESLLSAGFRPTRTVVLAFGFDEEIGGPQGAAHISEHLERTYGEDSFLLLVDEGGGFVNLLGSVIAVPAIAEKGAIDVRVEVTSPGGHSSVPPDHTTIGILSRLVVHLEENPFEAKLLRESPVFWTFQCVAAYAPDLDETLRERLKNSVHSDEDLELVQEALFDIKPIKELVRTTQAVNVINGGVKANALPELAWTVVNHRIDTNSSVAEVKTRYIQVLTALAQKFNLSYTAFGEPVSEPGAPVYGTLDIAEARDASLEPAPISPVKAPEYSLLSGTIKAAYNAHRNLTGDDNIIVAPGLVPVNTDTRHYWNLTDHIYRYGHVNSASAPPSGFGLHTINECFPADAYFEQIRFFTALILNADEFRA